MKRILNLIGICAVFILLFSPSSFAAVLNSGTVEGTVGNVERDILTVMEQTSDDLKIAVQVQANEQTEFKKVSSIGQLKQGDRVTVSYKEENGQKIATSIVKIESTEKHI